MQEAHKLFLPPSTWFPWVRGTFLSPVGAVAVVGFFLLLGLLLVAFAAFGGDEEPPSLAGVAGAKAPCPVAGSALGCEPSAFLTGVLLGFGIRLRSRAPFRRRTSVLCDIGPF